MNSFQKNIRFKEKVFSAIDKNINGNNCKQLKKKKIYIYTYRPKIKTFNVDQCKNNFSADRRAGNHNSESYK